MLFLNPWLLAGLVAITLPIIIHLVRRQAAKPLDWGAMRFLFDTISVRRRKMEWEDLLLMATRCLLLALIALAIARPFLTPDSKIPWLFVLPAALAGVALLGASFVLGGFKARWITRGVATLLLLTALGLGWWEKYFNLRRFEASGRRDIALVIDASASMEISSGGKSVFQKAVEEAKQLVIESPRGTAFLVVLGGPAPEAKTAAPLTHRADVLGVLDSLQPLGGSFRAHEALGIATLALAQGTNASKEIIVFTDAQRSGWRFDEPTAWDQLEQAWKALPAMPKLLLRNFGEPPAFTNVAILSCIPSRALVGTDREVIFRVEISNSGKTMVTPGPIQLEIDQQKIGQNPVGMLQPGQQVTVEFRHRFTNPGSHIIRASVEANDDLAIDNYTERVIRVQDKLPVLLIDGNPTGSFFERASGYTALALAPSSAVLSGKSSTEKFMMDPRVVPASQVQVKDLANARVIILADVSRLPAALASGVAAKVANGAGLMIIAGPRSETAFYNNWSGLDGPLLPMPLGEEMVDAAGISPAPSTFVHEALAWFTKGGDLADSQVRRWRKLGESASNGVQAAAFNNGDHFLATRLYGSGRVILSSCALDARAGNLPAKRAFVPFIHELVAWAAGVGTDWNVKALWSPSVILQQSGGGLVGKYFRVKDEQDEFIMERTDATVDFEWNNDSPAQGVPGDQFAVVWNAMLIPPVSGDYTFEADADDKLQMSIATRAKWQGEKKFVLGSIRLEAGKAEPVEIRYEEQWGQASVKLYWTIPGEKRQIIPSDAWIPTLVKSNPLRVIDPKGLPRQAGLQMGRRGQELKIEGPAVPGIYQVTADERLAKLAGVKAAGQIPIAVMRDAEESSFTPMNEQDMALLRSRADLIIPQSAKDLLNVLEGKGFGREIARWLALAAATFLILESILARWVSRSRRTAEDVRVDFGENTVWRGEAR